VTPDLSLSPTVNEHLRAVAEAASSESLLAATRALVALCPTLPAHSDDQQAVISCLMELLATNNPGAAVAAVDGLIACGGAAVEPLLHNLDAHNYGARAWAVRALASIGDPRGLPVLEKAAGEDIGPSVRRAAARGLGNLTLADLEVSQRLRLQERCLKALEGTCRDGEWVVRYAAVVGVEQFLAEAPADLAQRAISSLERLQTPAAEEVPVVRLRARQALEAAATRPPGTNRP
jgi:phycocyanobilin lyase subunit beta